MLDNFLNNLPGLPPEAFTETGDVVKKVIDKVSDAVGWTVKPTANKTYQLQAEKYLIDQIENDSNMPPLAKAAAISKVRKLIKQYLHQQNILSIGLKFLNDSAEPENVDDDWLANFFEKAKNISKEEMAIIWGKIFAKEVNCPRSVSKSLVHILSVIDIEEARAFSKLVNFTVIVAGEYFSMVFFDKGELYPKYGLTFGEIMSLEDTGLVQISSALYSITLIDEKKMVYFDSEFDIGEIDTIAVGNVMLTKAGRELMSIIEEKEKIDEFAMFLGEILNTNSSRYVKKKEKN